ncbi:GNAT family acetyltransferase [Subtercola sp. Z020]|uniref:GNAT family acetyltransferase n=1 Tax=Subtercola sp. Z020 TaxID=2080582 RepID=UPI000CE86FF0|nr:GNAT family acetyltransferase [Subtercola sp. Z020]PPF82250.1 GNAT family acetyltransferase [Subtercola sp. Z020]
MQIRSFAAADTEAVVALWEQCGLVRAWNDPRKDIARKLTVQPELFLVGVDDEAADRADLDGSSDAEATVIGTAMVGYDGHRGWINYLAVSPDHRGRGYGRAFMDEAERLLIALGCPKLNLQVREGNDSVIAFYEAIGYANDRTVSLGKRLIAD